MGNVHTVSALVVDDNELLARGISDLLLSEGYRVWTARDGMQGYSIYRQSTTEVVVTDIEMPNLDGFEMMRCIRTVNPSVKTIYMSGAPAEYRRSLIAETEKFGVAVLRKPFAGRDLLNILSSAGENIPLVVPGHEWSRNQEKVVWKKAG